ncbi:MAG: dihydrofolate reductase [Gammaproteobacteria bacterium]
MRISLIVAMADNRVIGIDNRMPWHLSADLKKFKALTMGKAIVMGRKTYESIGRPLPGRENAIISRDKLFTAPGCRVFASMDAALSHFRNHEEVFIIGGSSLYAEMLPFADTLYLTRIHRNFCGDTFFPEIPAEQWQTLEHQKIDDDPDVDFSYSFIKLKRKISDSKR